MALEPFDLICPEIARAELRVCQVPASGAATRSSVTLKNAFEPRMNTDGYGCQRLAQNHTLTRRVDRCLSSPFVVIRVHSVVYNFFVHLNHRI
jgi:hypothetical protein